ncbi:GCG_CRPN prefix-to-repeats domain-containing protein, partial [Rhodoblastus acidophilus]
QAGAMPLAGAAPAASAPVEQAAWGCGPGWHPNPWGRCVPNRRYWGGGPYYGPRRWGGPGPYYGPRRHYYRGW